MGLIQSYILTLYRTASAAALKAHKELPFRKRGGTVTAREEAQIETRYRTTFKRVSMIEEEVLTFEDEHSLPERWPSEVPSIPKERRILPQLNIGMH